MTVFVTVRYDCPSPGEHEVAGAGAERDSDAQPHVERHEDEHEEVTDDDLDDVQNRLQHVPPTQQHRPVTVHSVFHRRYS